MSVLAPLGSINPERSLYLALERLIGGHMAIVANSGGGKSGLIRRLLEVTHGHVQHIVLDIEDEFYTLREKLDYVIVGGDGADAPAAIGTAAELARSALEHGFSLIVQLNDFGDRAPDFVSAFIGGLMRAPREHWRPLLVIIDEAQRFVSPKVPTVAQAAVADLVNRGRKRGFTAILASLRLADAIAPEIRAMVNNWLLGRVGQTLDRNAMADQLGFTAREGREQLRGLEQRQFWALGPALAAEPTLFHVDDAETTIVEVGQARVPTPPAAGALREILAALAPPAPTSDPSIPSDPAEAYNVGRAAGEMLIERDRRIAELEARIDELQGERGNAVSIAVELMDKFERLARDVSALRPRLVGERSESPAGDPSSPDDAGRGATGPAIDSRPGPSRKKVSPETAGHSHDGLNVAALAMAAILKGNAPGDWSWPELALVTGRRPGSGYLGKARAAMMAAGWVADAGNGRVRASEALIAADFPKARGVPDPSDLIAEWARELRGPGGEILLELERGGPGTRVALGGRIGKSSTSGWFGKGMKDLVRSNLVVIEGGVVRLADLLRGKA